jgi:L-aspartate oxidase
LSNVSVSSDYFVVDIITQHHLGFLITKSTPDIQCYGVYALNLKTNQILAKPVMIENLSQYKMT